MTHRNIKPFFKTVGLTVLLFIVATVIALVISLLFYMGTTHHPTLTVGISLVLIVIIASYIAYKEVHGRWNLLYQG